MSVKKVWYVANAYIIKHTYSCSTMRVTKKLMNFGLILSYVSPILPKIIRVPDKRTVVEVVMLLKYEHLY